MFVDLCSISTDANRGTARPPPDIRATRVGPLALGRAGALLVAVVARDPTPIRRTRIKRADVAGAWKSEVIAAPFETRPHCIARPTETKTHQWRLAAPRA